MGDKYSHPILTIIIIGLLALFAVSFGLSHTLPEFN